MDKSEAKLTLIRRTAYKDLYYFTKFVLGRDLMEEQPHRELCDVLMALVQPMFPDVEFTITTPWVVELRDNPEELKRMALLLLARGTFKSTIASNAFPIWLAWHDINIRIMIDTETLGNSKLYLAGIKDMIISNEYLRVICIDDAGDYILAPNTDIPGGFNEDSVIFAKRTRLGLKEPSIFCSGVDNARTGMHMEVIICDDLVSERNVKTPEQLQKTKDHYRFSLSLLEPTGKAVIIGTRYHMDDLYAELLGNTSFITLVRPAINDAGELYFPTRLTKAFLEEQRKSQGSYIYSSQYMLTPIADDTTPFKDIDIMRYSGKMVKGEDGVERMKYPYPSFIKKFMTVDLAISEKTTADDTVVNCFGATAVQDVYDLEYVADRMPPMKTIDYIFAFSEKWNIIDIGVEVVAYQRAFVYMLEAEMRRRGKFLRITELKAKGSKLERAAAYVPYVEQHKFYIREDMDKALKELTEFPFSKKDDLVDSVTYVPQMLKPYQAKTRGFKDVYKPGNSITGY